MNSKVIVGKNPQVLFLSARIKAEHSFCILFVAGLAQNFTVNGDNGIRRNNDRIGEIAAFCKKLIANGNAFAKGKLLYKPVRVGDIAALVGIRGDDLELDAKHFQNLATSGRF